MKNNLLKKSCLVLGAVLCLAVSTPAYADPIQMADGTIVDPAYCFDPGYYCVYNDDLFGYDTYELYQHFITAGQSEGRLGWDPADNVTMSSDAVKTSDVVKTTDGITEEMALSRINELRSVYTERMPWYDLDATSHIYQGYDSEISEGKYMTYAGARCTGFAYLVNDYAFGDTPNARFVFDGSHENFHVGDILEYRTKRSSHYVVILSKSDKGITVTEGNYNRRIHWDRFISWDELDRNFMYLITRYEL